MGDVHQALVKKFIETQAVVLSPICPHVAEHVWSLIGHKESILKSRWPVVAPADLVLIQSGAYLNQTAHDLRIRLRSYLTSVVAKGGSKKAASVAVEKPTHATIWIAKTYPTWQSIILTLLKEKFQVISPPRMI